MKEVVAEENEKKLFLEYFSCLILKISNKNIEEVRLNV